MQVLVMKDKHINQIFLHSLQKISRQYQKINGGCTALCMGVMFTSSFTIKTFFMKRLPSISAILLFAMCSIITANAKSDFNEACFNRRDSSLEKKVDYLERIYFSGENKAGINSQILIVLQEIEGKTPTPSLAKQVTFLLEIKEKALSAGSACEILDLLAVGIYNLDAAEGRQQGVIPPSDKAKEKTTDALSSLNKLNSATQSISSSASSLAWSSYLLSGKTGGFGTAGKISGAASSLGAIAGTAGQLSELGKILGIGKKKDKACSDVPKKTIEIGQHEVAGASSGINSTPPKNQSQGTNTTVSSNVKTTVITIVKISSAALRELNDSLKTKPGVQSSEKSYNETKSTITVVYTGNTDSISDWVEDKLGTKFKLLSSNKNTISLAKK
jgi:hypothetical protein